MAKSKKIQNFAKIKIHEMIVRPFEKNESFYKTVNGVLEQGELIKRYNISDKTDPKL
jgi:hypothetical protein